MPQYRNKHNDAVQTLLPPNSAIDTRHSRSSQAYDLLREAIVSLWFKPGEAISEKLIAEQLKISRTPVREAIMKLADEGLLTVYQRSRTIVSPIRLADVYEGQLVREALELALVRRAASRFNSEFDRRFATIMRRQQQCAEWNDHNGFAPVDEEFHKTIAECAAAPGVWRIVSSAKAQLDRVRRLALPEPGLLERLIGEHSAVLANLKRQDGDMAAQALKIHLDSTLQTIREQLERHPNLFSTNGGGPAEQNGEGSSCLPTRGRSQKQAEVGPEVLR